MLVPSLSRPSSANVFSLCSAQRAGGRVVVNIRIWLRNSRTPLLSSTSLYSNSCTIRLVSEVSPIVSGLETGAEVGKA